MMNQFLNKEVPMKPITLLRGYLMSRILHGMRMVLLSASSTAFICHSSVAQNKPNKTPSSDESGCGGGYASNIPDYNANTLVNLITYNAYTENKYSLLPTNNNPLQTAGIISYPAAEQISSSSPGDKLEDYYIKLQSYNILQTVQKQTGATDADMQVFTSYYHDKLFADDRNAFWKEVETGNVKTDADIKQYAEKQIAEYVHLYQNFQQIKKDYPNSVSEYANAKPPSAPIACNPACDNIDFEGASLSGWSAFYATNTSTTAAFTNSAPAGGPCGAVSKSAYDPTTLTYQVSLTSGPGLDPVAGALIPIVCPTGGNYSCRIGDSTRNGAQMGIVQQSFMVTPLNANFTYMYAVVLENPSHVYFEQPYFNVQMLDQNGNPIPNCGNYSVVSGPGLPGYTPIYYAPNGDTVYCKPWTTVFVPLQAYIGQCVTIKITTADCALGGHFGYAYFDATCSVGVISSSPAVCGKNITLTAPGGVGSYQWSGPCIIGSTTNQTVTVSCAGTYKVILASVSNSLCSDTLTVVVPGSVPPTATVNSTNVSCNGGNNGSANVIVSGGVLPYTYSWTPSGGNSATASNLSAGSYTITVTDSNGCQVIDSVIITQPPVLTSTIVSSTNVTCNGGNNGSAIATAGGGTAPYGYSWSSGSSTASANSLTAGSYTVTVTDANGCFVTSAITITQPLALVVSVSSSNGVSCNGWNNGSAAVTVSGGTNPYSYAWSNGGSSASTSNLAAGTYSITVTDANGCTSSTSVIITQPATLVASVGSGSDVSCYNGSNGSANAVATGGTTPYSYLWSNASSSATASNLTAGSYSVTVTDANGCTSTANVSITQPAILTPSISAYNNVHCNGGNTGSATASSTGGTGPYNYSWTSGSSSATANNLTAGSYTVTVTDAHGCTGSVSVLIQQPFPLSVTSAFTAPSCFGMSNGSANASASGGTSPYSYAWSNGSSSATASNLSAGTYTISVTDSNGCTISSPFTVTQPTALIAGISSTTNVSCNGGNNGSASASATGGTGSYSYVWNTLPVQTNSTATSLKAGIYIVTVTDANGCTATISAAISQPTPVLTTVTADTIVCSGSPVLMTAAGLGGNGSFSYQWSAGGGTSSTYTVNPVNTTTYTVMAIDGNGCQGNIVNVTIHTLKLTATAVTVSPGKTICQGDTVHIYVIVDTTNSGKVSIAWSNSLYGPGPFTVAPLVTTTYTVNVSDHCGNTIPKTITITVNPLPVVNIPNQSGASCKEVTLFFKDTNRANLGSTYDWNFGDGSSSVEISPAHTYSSTGQYIVNVIVISPNGCKASADASVVITIYPTAVAGFTANPERATIINPVISFTDNSTETTQWRWDFGDGGTSNSENPSHTYNAVGGYKVELFTNNSYGCADSIADSVFIMPDFRIFIPNAFTPDGDDLNDYFTAKGIGIEQFNMMIFDRWGNLIYTTEDINRGWNGTVNGGNKIAQEDTYVYKIQITDIFKEQHSYIGAVTLIK
jgi:gliding motility-associated-like protein